MKLLLNGLKNIGSRLLKEKTPKFFKKIQGIIGAVGVGGTIGEHLTNNVDYDKGDLLNQIISLPKDELWVLGSSLFVMIILKFTSRERVDEDVKKKIIAEHEAAKNGPDGEEGDPNPPVPPPPGSGG